MPFLQLDNMVKETVTPKHSTAYGELVTGDSIEVGRLRFKAGEGAEPHAHEQEQIVIVLEGKVRMNMGDEQADLGPGCGFHARPYELHGLQALEDSLIISCKNTLDGVGHKI